MYSAPIHRSVGKLSKPVGELSELFNPSAIILPVGCAYFRCNDISTQEIFGEDFKISRKISRFQRRFQDFVQISRFHARFRKDFKISAEISAEVYEISASGRPLEQK